MCDIDLPPCSLCDSEPETRMHCGTLLVRCSAKDKLCVVRYNHGPSGSGSYYEGLWMQQQKWCQLHGPAQIIKQAMPIIEQLAHIGPHSLNRNDMETAKHIVEKAQHLKWWV